MNHVVGHRQKVGLLTRLVLAVACTLIAAGCTTSVNINAGGAAPATATSLALTVKEIWFSNSGSATPDNASAWVKKVLATPVTLNIATLSSGALLTLATQLSVPADTYKQVYLVTADSSDALASSASSAGLTYNTQITEQASTGVVTTAPLEWLAPEVGLRVPTNLNLQQSLTHQLGSSATTSSSGTTSATGSGTVSSTLVVDIDASRDVLPYAHGAYTGYLASPRIRVLDAAGVGGIRGSVDASALAAGHAPVIVSAQTLDSSGTHHTIAMQRVVDSSGGFWLYPLPAVTKGKTAYDIVISCADAQTVIVRAVPVTAGAISTSTVVQTAAITLTPATAVYASAAPPTPLPGGSEVSFLQTINASGELPYAVARSPVDPLTHLLPTGAVALAGGPLMVGQYAAGSTIALTPGSPVGGNGAYVAQSGGLYRLDTLAAGAVVVSGSATTPTPVLVPLPRLATGSVAGRLTVTLSAPLGRYDAGFLAVSSGNRLVETADVSSLLAAGGGSLTLSGLPAGSVLVPSDATSATGTGATQSVAGAVYEVTVRAWSTSSSQGVVARALAPTTPVLGNTATGSAIVTLQ